jgi:hypothetical protein
MLTGHLNLIQFSKDLMAQIFFLSQKFFKTSQKNGWALGPPKEVPPTFPYIRIRHSSLTSGAWPPALIKGPGGTIVGQASAKRSPEISPREPELA